MKAHEVFKVILLSLIAMLILVIIGSDGKDFFYLSIIIFYFLFLRENRWIDIINIIFFILTIELLFSLNVIFVFKNYEGLYILLLTILLPILHFIYIVKKYSIPKDKDLPGSRFIIYIVLFVMLAVVVDYITKETKISQRFEVSVIKNSTKIYSSEKTQTDKQCIEIKVFKYTAYLYPEYRIYLPFERRYISEEKEIIGSIKKCTDA